MEPLYRGMWADRLEDGQVIPVGGSIFSDALSTMLELDFSSFDARLSSYRGPEPMSQGYRASEAAVKEWLEEVGANVDSYLFFVATNVQQSVQALLEAVPSVPTDSLERRARYADDRARLSDLRGASQCAEQSALGQYLLQNVLEDGYSSAYVGGITSVPPNDTGDHAWIVVTDPRNEQVIFDIARPISTQNLPRILKPDVPFTYDQLANEKNLLIGATEVLRGGRLHFGVGHPLLSTEPLVLGADGTRSPMR